MQRLSPFATEPLSAEPICPHAATVFSLHDRVVQVRRVGLPSRL